jgi:hypothetical protein
MNRRQIIGEVRGFAAVTAVAVAATLGLMYGIDHDPDLAPSDTVSATVIAPPVAETPETETITEDDPRWNCITMGNHICGPDWEPIPESLYAGLGVSDDEQCAWHVADTTTVVCSDEQVFTS